MQLLRALKLLTALLMVFSALANTKPVPRFVTIKSNKVNTRVGPGLQYPIASVIVNKSEPVEVIAELENWRQIKDYDKQISWVHVSLLSPKRSVIIASGEQILLYKTPFCNSAVVARVWPLVRCDFLNYCTTKVCKVKCNDIHGWIERKHLWGIYDHECVEVSVLQLYLKTIF